MRYIALFILLSNLAYAEVDLVKVDKSESRMFLLAGETIVKKYGVAFAPFFKIVVAPTDEIAWLTLQCVC